MVPPQAPSDAPDEPKPRDVVSAVADFLADSQDPAGGWLYPHPRSSGLLLSQAVEHAWQLASVDALLGPQGKNLDAIERVLRERYHGWKRTGRVVAGVTGWESVTGVAKDGAALGRLYRHPAERGGARDYTEGRLSLGPCPPEGLVYVPGMLSFYLRHRPASRLLVPPANDEPLGKLLAGVREGRPIGFRPH